MRNSHLIVILSTFSSQYFLLALWFVVPSVFATTYPYTPQQRLVGQIEYALLPEPSSNIYDLARKYQVGYDAFLLANPHLEGVKIIPAGTLVYLPHAAIVPPIKANSMTINIAEKRMYYYSLPTKTLYVWPVGVARIDYPTPLATLRVVGKRSNPTWYVTPEGLAEAYSLGYTDHPKIVPPGPNNPLGSHAISLSGGNYRIHSTNNPQTIGTRNTAGCINMYPEDIKQLYPMLKINTTVTIINAPIKSYATSRGIYIEPHPHFATTSDQISSDPVNTLQTLYNDHIAEAALTQYFTTAKLDNVTAVLQNPSGLPHHFIPYDHTDSAKENSSSNH